MRQAICIFFAIILTCATIREVKHVRDDVKSSPQHTGVEAQFDPYVKSYIQEAKEHHIKFTHQVTVGITQIKDPRTDGHKTIGLCTYGQGWREIDFDSDFWKTASPKRKKVLAYHELTHCYCGRDHDYGDGQRYLSPELERILGSFQKYPFYARKPGYYLDQCPLSIMHPVILEEACIEKHMDEYLQEMWNRCSPY